MHQTSAKAKHTLKSPSLKLSIVIPFLLSIKQEMPSTLGDLTTQISFTSAKESASPCDNKNKAKLASHQSLFS